MSPDLNLALKIAEVVSSPTEADQLANVDRKAEELARSSPEADAKPAEIAEVLRDELRAK